ncbi:hypothetical protein BH20ACT24_BH20ACT24_00160 [soil metagenome]
MREETLEEEDEDLQPDAETEAEPEEAAPEARAEEPDETSLDEILEKPAAADEEEDEESILSLGSEEPLETLSVKIEPKKDTEFVCQKCYLVKPIRSQLADKARMYCRDCA